MKRFAATAATVALGALLVLAHWQTNAAGDVARPIPLELVGKLLITEGEQERSEFAREGTLTARVNLGGREGIIKARVQLEGKTLLITSQNPNTKKDVTKKFVIKTLTDKLLIFEDEKGALFKLTRLAQQGDPLPSWKDGPNKEAILAYVKAVTSKDGPDFVPVADRIATFDNDGTLWCEQPTVELVFTQTRLKALAAKDATLKEKQPFKAALEGDKEYLHKAGFKALLELVATTHGDMLQDDFDEDARAFFKTAKHPKFDQPYPKMTYRPMVELLHYLRANGFQTWICSGGFMDLMRQFSQESYGIPPSQVIGSSMKKKSMEKDGKRVLFLLGQILCVCDQDDKPVEIGLHIGKRPIFAAGNVRTGGDIAMLRYCQGSKYKSLQIMVNHDDEAREFAYAEKDRASLNAAEKHGWQIVSMKNDWQRVFAFEK